MEGNHFEFAYLNKKAIIKDEAALLPRYDPTQVICKEEENQLINAIMPITKGNLFDNIFLHGVSGSGKTVLVKHVFDHLRDHTRNILCLYINCWHHSTSMAVYTKIADALGNHVSRRGRSTDETLDHIIEVINYSKIPILVALDDFDGLLCRRDFNLLYNLSKLKSEYGSLLGIIAIAEHKNILSILDNKLRQELCFNEIECKNYTKFELFQILKKRAQRCLTEGSYNESVLDAISDFSQKHNGNVKLALEILRRVANTAEEKGKEKIDIQDFDELKSKIEMNEKALSREEQLIFDILKKGETTSSQLYCIFSQKLVRTKRQMFNYIDSLEGKGFVQTRIIDYDNGMGTKLIKLKYNGDECERISDGF